MALERRTFMPLTHGDISGPKSSMLKKLQRIGKLPPDFPAEKLLPLLEHESEKIRMLAAQNLGKARNTEFLPALRKAAESDSATLVRREAASAIGRMRNRAAIPVLVRLTRDKDPKVVVQALRGLLSFDTKDRRVCTALKNLRQHPNEIIQDAIKWPEERKTVPSDAGTSQPESPDFMRNLVVEGNVLTTLKHAPSESIHLTFTSPPYYNARDYSIYASYKEYLSFLEKVFKQTLRVTKQGRFFVLNTSPVITPRIGRQYASRRYAIPFDIHPILTKMGWEFIDDIVWAKPESSVKNRNGGFYQHRKPLAYKPNSRTEYLMVYRKKCGHLIDWNIRQYGADRMKKSLVSEKYETSNVWNIDPVFDRGHSAVFPEKLCRQVIQYYSFSDDLVFDPFGGSGTLGCAAVALGRRFFTTELSPRYISRMRTKLSMHGSLFGQEARFVKENDFRSMAKGGRKS